jgi:hypothetical protein
MNYLQQQERFDDFRQEFNCERPIALTDGILLSYNLFRIAI